MFVCGWGREGEAKFMILWSMYFKIEHPQRQWNCLCRRRLRARRRARKQGRTEDNEVASMGGAATGILRLGRSDCIMSNKMEQICKHSENASVQADVEWSRPSLTHSLTPPSFLPRSSPRIALGQSCALAPSATVTN